MLPARLIHYYFDHFLFLRIDGIITRPPESLHRRDPIPPCLPPALPGTEKSDWQPDRQTPRATSAECEKVFSCRKVSFSVVPHRVHRVLQGLNKCREAMETVATVKK